MAHENTIHIRILISVVGNNFAYAARTEVHAPEHIARDLIAAGHATLIAVTPAQRAEKPHSPADHAEKRKLP